MDLLEFINDIASRGGLPTDNAELKTLLASPALAGIPVPAEVEAAAKSLLTLEAAKNNTTLKNHYVAQALGGIDGSLNERLTGPLAELLPQAVIDAINGERATGKKVSLLLDELTRLKAKSAPNDNEKEQIRQLSEKVNKLNEEKQREVAAAKQELLTYRQGQAVKKAMGGVKWADHFPETTRETLLQLQLEAEMAKRGVVMAYDPATDTVSLKQKGDASLDYFVDGKSVTLADLTQQVAADAKFIAVQGTPSGGSTPSNQPPVQLPHSGGSNSPSKLVPGFGNAMDRAMRDAMANIGDD